jgi:hypothetical protein
MAYKFDIDRADLCPYHFPLELKVRTSARLLEMANVGMEEMGHASFGVRGVMSGLYIEKVWNYSDQEWADYMTWVKGLLNKKNLREGY